MAFAQEFYADAEGGITNGTTLTNANNGTANGNFNFSRVDVGAGNSVTASNAWANKAGTLAYLITQVGANRPGVYGVTGAARTNPSASFQFSISALPAVTGAFFRWFSDAAFAVTAIDIQITTTGKIVIRDSVGAVNSSSSTLSLAINTPYTAVFEYNDSTKLVTANIYQTGTNTIAATMTLTLLANVTIQSWELGVIATSANYSINLDRLNVGFGGTATRQDIVNVAPTATRVTAQFQSIDAGGSAVITWNFSDSDGTMAAGATVTCTSRPSGAPLPTINLSGYVSGSSTATITATMPLLANVGEYIFTVNATDNGGLAATGQVTGIVECAPAINTPTDIRVFNDLGYVQFGSQANLTTAMIDGDVATGVESPASPVAEPMEIQTGALKTNGITCRVNGYINGSGTGSYRLRCFKADKTTLLQTFNQTLTTTPTWYTHQLSSATLALIPLALDRFHLWWIIDSTVT